MRAEIWLRSADGLTGFMDFGTVRPSIYTAVMGHMPLITMDSTADDMTVHIERRRYDYWKMEGDKAWYREVIERREGPKMNFDVKKIEEGLEAMEKAGVCQPGREAVKKVLEGLGVKFPEFRHPEIGDRFSYAGSTYLLASCGVQKRILISLRDGNRFTEAVDIAGYKMDAHEWGLLTAQKPYAFKFIGRAE